LIQLIVAIIDLIPVFFAAADDLSELDALATERKVRSLRCAVSVRHCRCCVVVTPILYGVT
jgi:hypothetical protein